MNLQLTMTKCYFIFPMSLFMMLFIGCSLQGTTVQICNINAKDIRQALWEIGGKDDSSAKSRQDHYYWKPLNDDQSRYRFQYTQHESTGFLGYTVDHTDSIQIRAMKPNCSQITLRCEEGGFMEWGSHRNLYKERDILTRLTKTVETYPDSHIQWLGTWYPPNDLIVITNHNAEWIALKGVNPSSVTRFFEHGVPQYSKGTGSDPEQVLFNRTLDRNPYEEFNLFAKAFGTSETQWDSHEKILVKTVPKENSKILVVGIQSIGIEFKKWKDQGLFQTTEQEQYVDRGAFLKEKIRDSLITYLKHQPEPFTYVDPSPWIEEIPIDPLNSELAKAWKGSGKNTTIVPGQNASADLIVLKAKLDWVISQLSEEEKKELDNIQESFDQKDPTVFSGMSRDMAIVYKVMEFLNKPGREELRRQFLIE
jgi:hypothetical protein